jgi:hypothetical protein
MTPDGRHVRDAAPTLQDGHATSIGEIHDVLMGSIRRPARAMTLLTLVAALTAACDRSPTAADAVQADGLRLVLAAAALAEPGSVEIAFRDLAWRLATTVEPAPRLPVLDELFDLAMARVARDRGQAAADRLRQQHTLSTDNAWTAVAAGDDDLADLALAEARAVMVAHTVDALGETIAVAYVAILGLAIDNVSDRLERPGHSLHPRARRMLASARNLHGDAGIALLRADVPGALDVAAHGAGLINSLVATLDLSR